MDQNGSKWIKMNPNETKLIQMKPNASRRIKINEMDKDGSRWIKLDQNGSISDYSSYLNLSKRLKSSSPKVSFSEKGPIIRPFNKMPF